MNVFQTFVFRRMKNIKKCWSGWTCVPLVCQPAKGDVSHDVDDSQNGHEEGGVLVADAGAQSVRYQIHERQAAAAGQEQEGHGQTQEVRLQQEGVLRSGEGEASLLW